jgi:undecaprenyl-diphosphatase
MTAEAERWIDAIAADISGGAKAAVAAIRRALAGLPAIGTRIAAWFAFVSRRRIDRRQAVFPRSFPVFAALGVAAIAATVRFADAPYLAAAKGTPIFGGFFGIVTRLGESAWSLYASGAVVIAILLAGEANLRGARRAARHRLLLYGYYLFTAVAFSGLLANLAKNLIGRARPPFTPPGEIWLSRPFGDNYDFAAMPSGHATTAGAVAVALSLLFPAARVFFLLIGVLIAISRPALGVHFPSDVLAGFLFGGAFAWLYARSFARKRLLFAFGPRGALPLRGRLGVRALERALGLRPAAARGERARGVSRA